jgi:hypothetical protein
VQKKELIKQLAKNREVMNAMNCTDPKKLATDVHVAACAKEGSLTWSEFLDFFFLKNATFADRIDANDWWNKIDENGKSIQTTGLLSGPLSGKAHNDDVKSQDLKQSRQASLLKEFKEIEMTPALKMLLNSRKLKTEQDVEQDFMSRAKRPYRPE